MNTVDEILGLKRAASSDREPKRICFGAKPRVGPDGITILELEDGIRIIKQNLGKIVDQARSQSSALLEANASFRVIISTGNKLHTRCSTTIYDTVFRMCIQRNPVNFSKRCYELVDNFISDFLQEPITNIIQCSGEQETDLFLRQMIQLIATSLNLLHAVTFGFSYLDRFYTPNYDLMEVVRKAKRHTRKLLMQVFEIDSLNNLGRFDTVEQLEKLAIIFSKAAPLKLTVPTQSCLWEKKKLEHMNKMILRRTFEIIPFTRSLRDDLTSIIFYFL